MPGRTSSPVVSSAPRKNVVLKAGDELLASGPEEGRERLAWLCGYRLEIDEETGRVDLSPAS